MDKNFVTLSTYWLLAEAEFACGKLADEGIEAFVSEGQTGGLTSALSNVRLMVNEADAERALAIMAKWPAPRSPLDTEASDFEPLRCLACGKRMLAEQTECQECGWSYLGTSDDEVDDSSKGGEGAAIASRDIIENDSRIRLDQQPNRPYASKPKAPEATAADARIQGVPPIVDTDWADDCELEISKRDCSTVDEIDGSEPAIGTADDLDTRIQRNRPNRQPKRSGQ
jgi:hypothetical protein